MAMTAGNAVEFGTRSALSDGRDRRHGPGHRREATRPTGLTSRWLTRANPQEPADATVGEIEGHGRRGAAFEVDVADEEAVSDLFDTVEASFGHVDVVVNTAGINRPATLVDLDLELTSMPFTG